MKNRDKALRKFHDEPRIGILLMSIKCGGRKVSRKVQDIYSYELTKRSVVGLNITVASRVIIVDPWWNYALEEQGMFSLNTVLLITCLISLSILSHFSLWTD